VPGSLAFTRQHRLLTGSQYQTVFDHPKWKVGNSVFLLLATPSDQPCPRLGLVIGRKRAKRAVDRGCVKRRAREQFRLRQDALAGLDIILLVRGRVDHPDPAQVTLQLGQLFDKLLAKCRQA
jgi:ribonuclease P protein component